MTHDVLPKTRREAKSIGSTYYFTGKPCKHGHISKRFTIGMCYECSRSYLKSHPPKYSPETRRRSYLRNRLQALALGRRRYLKDPAAHKLKAAARRAVSKMATPAWSDQGFVRCIYEIARRVSRCTGIPWEVDHVLPLQSSLVCGLHAHTNLQVIPAAINRRKNDSLCV